LKICILVLKVFGYIWLTAASILILASIMVVGLVDGFSAVQKILSPFNIANIIVTIITLAPGIGALSLGKRLVKKESKPH
jgi:hypothetical protein